MKNNLKKGISLISLIIIIIVIIILAAIVIFTGLNTPDRANFAKYAQEVSDVRTAIVQEYANMKTKNAIENKTRSDSQIYYTMATGNEIDMNTDTSTLKAGTVDELGFVTVPDTLAGSEFYEVTDNEKISGWLNNKGYFEPLGTEKHYITDKGEFFILPGYRVADGETTKWYVNESKYYVSDKPIRYVAQNTNLETNSEGKLSLVIEQLINESKTKVLLKISCGVDVPTLKEWLQILGTTAEGKEKLKDMYAATMTHGSALWSQCMSSYTDVKDVWEKQYDGANGSYLDEYEMIIQNNRYVLAEYYIYLAETTTEEFVESCTAEELKEMYAYGYTNGAATWSQCMSQYEDLKDYYTKTKASSGNYTNEYDYLIKTGFLNVNVVNSKYANTTFTCDGQSIRGIKNAELIISSNGEYEVTATDLEGNTGKKVISVTDCKTELFEYPADKTENYILNQESYQAVVPAGYAYGISENVGAISKGLVITDSINSDGKSNGNEFVWIPIDKTTLNVAGTDKPMAIYLNSYDANMNKIYAGTHYGAYWNTVNQSYAYNLKTTYNEPGYINITEEYNLTNRSGVGYFQKEYDKMIKSVITYGGFYVARYEMGYGTDYSKLGIEPVSASDIETRYWYGLYNQANSYATSTDSTKSVVSSMIWGSQYDAMLHFMKATGNINKLLANANGNHSGTKTRTGMYFGSDSIINIYDLEGNMLEWTQETYKEESRTTRGGHYSKIDTPTVRNSNNAPKNIASFIGTRMSLYIK